MGQHDEPPCRQHWDGNWDRRLRHAHEGTHSQARMHSRKLTRQRAHAKAHGPMQERTKTQKFTDEKNGYTHTYTHTHPHANNCTGIPTVTGQHSQPEWAAHWTGRLTLLQAHSGLDQRWEFHTGTERWRVGE